MTRLPSKAALAAMLRSDAETILDGEERSLRQYYPDDNGVAYDPPGRGYYRRQTARRLKKIAALRSEFRLAEYRS